MNIRKLTAKYRVNYGFTYKWTGQQFATIPILHRYYKDQFGNSAIGVGESYSYVVLPAWERKGGGK